MVRARGEECCANISRASEEISFPQFVNDIQPFQQEHRQRRKNISAGAKKFN
jgi:hypothetical protein